MSLEATDPNGVTGTVDLAATSPGAFAVATDAPVAGVYTFHYVARGTSFAGVPFTREQVRTVGVWAGGDDPPPRSGSGDGVRAKFLADPTDCAAALWQGDLRRCGCRSLGS